MTPQQRPRRSVAFVLRRFGARFGGAEAYAEHLVSALLQEGRVTVHVFCQEFDSPLDVPHTLVPYRRYLPRWANLASFTRACASLTRDFDVVHSHENSGLGDVQVVHVMPVRYSRFHAKRSWLRSLSTWLSLRWHRYLAMEAQRLQPRPGRVVVAASALVQRQLAEAYPDLPPARVMPPGVWLPSGSPDHAHARAVLGLAPDAIHALLVANDPERKGIHATLRALALLPTRYHLLFVGGETSTAERVQSYAENDARLAGRVHVWPGRRDVDTFYQAADLCVFPTRGDAFGMVPLEAMAHSLPVVLSDGRYCGFAQHLQNERHALVLADPEDDKALAAAITRLAAEPTLRSTLRTQGRRLAERFSWEHLARDYAKLYDTAGHPGTDIHG